MELLVGEGDEADSGSVIAVIDATVDVGSASAPAPAPAPAVEAVAASSEGGRQATASTKGPQTGPAARQAAAGAGVDIQSVQGSGVRGRVLSKDVAAAAASGGQASPATTLVDTDALEERVPMSPLRRTIARRLVEAQQTAAMLTTFNEVDLTNVIALRKRYQDRFVDKYGRKPDS